MSNIDKYNKILEYFNVSNNNEDLLKTYSYVSMDNIHNAIIYEDITYSKHEEITLDLPINCYIIKAKQNAIDEFRNNNLHTKILYERFKFKSVYYDEISIPVLYNFTEEETLFYNQLEHHMSPNELGLTTYEFNKKKKQLLSKMID